MRLTFVCSSLEPGRDGVGDYTHRLAESLVRQGHTVHLMALNDRHAVANATCDFGIVRLASSTPWADRIKRARALVEASDPDWISVQLVAYGFDDRGLVWRLGERLRELRGSVPVHLMFHELWIGGGERASLRRRVEGRLQKRHILQMVRQLNPAVVHAQASPYVALLRQNGVAATQLPLFGNIPIDFSTDRSWLCEAFREAGVTTLLGRRQDAWLFGLFGTLHSEWMPEPLLSRIRRAAAARRKQPVLIAMGRLGSAGDRIWSDLGRTHGDILRICLGEQPADRISQALQALDFGITASPLALVGKSGTVAAMLDHGLPVIVSRNDVSFGYSFDAAELREPLLIPLDDDFDKRLANPPRRTPRETVDDVAAQFIRSLEASRPCGS